MKVLKESEVHVAELRQVKSNKRKEEEDPDAPKYPSYFRSIQRNGSFHSLPVHDSFVICS